MTLEEAVLLIEALLEEINEEKRSDLVIDRKNLTEISSHWIIPYQSKRYLETGDDFYRKRDTSPYAIDKNNGEIDPTIDTSWMLIIQE